MPEKYFYKGYEIVPMITHVLVKSPALKNRVVKVVASSNEAKLWIEQDLSMSEIRESARKIDEILAK
jgi:hypothetical protein